MRFLLAIVLLLTLAGPALAQTRASPIVGDYDELYLVTGRALDARGIPARGATVIVELHQEGVVDSKGSAPRVVGTVNCNGDFITDFRIKYIDPKGTAKVTLLGAAGTENATVSVPLDPFFRRSETLLRLNSEWPATCRDQTDVWAVSATLKVRFLNRTEPYDVDGTTFHAKPYSNIFHLRFEAPGGNVVCPPDPQDQTGRNCETFIVDERGDKAYTFTLDQPFAGGGTISVLLGNNETLTLKVDPTTRLVTRFQEMTGQGPPEAETPFPIAGGLLVVALAAMAYSRSRR